MAHDAGTEDDVQPIVPLIDPSNSDPAVRRAFASISVGRGGVANIFRAMGSSPELLELLAPIGTFFRASSTLPDEVREAVILAVAHDAGCAYEWSQHVRVARRLGLDHLRAIGLGDTPYEDELVNAAVSVGRAAASALPLDPVPVEHVVEMIGYRGLVEVTMLAGYYEMLGKLIAAWRVPLDETIPAEPMPRGRNDG